MNKHNKMSEVTSGVDNLSSEEKQYISSLFGGRHRFPIYVGSFGSEILLVNRIISELLSYYRKHNSVRVARVFTGAGAEGCKILSGIYRIPTREYLDLELLYRMYPDYCSIINSAAKKEKPPIEADE